MFSVTFAFYLFPPISDASSNELEIECDYKLKGIIHVVITFVD